MHPFEGNPLDRAADKRNDTAWLDARRDDPRTRVIALCDGKPLVHNDRLAYVSERGNLFLGTLDDVAYFAVEMESGEGFEELRGVALKLPHEEAAIVAAAKSLFDWHRRHGFCAVCGTRTDVAMAGWKRVCPSCHAEHFPRVDPVVIMLPVRGNRCLLGRQHAWPPGRMAPLAGFVEPGETIDEACARELREEAQLVAKKITYLGSQPWPFPSSLMIGLIAEVEDGEAIADTTEIEELRWFTREELRDVIEGKHPEVSPPTRLGISFYLITVWSAKT
ncbi:MAG TPA: NAD(+) diphosphatase [Thermoanaerobaculia bacterium]|nr:NAD(+) diphosphatase [Thermoanaerobaculia bacterium]